MFMNPVEPRRSASGTFVSARVLFALLVREMATRFGGTWAGYLWALIEPVAFIALLSFIAPYAYIAGAGSGEMPLIAWIVIGLLMVFFGTASVIRILRQIRAPEPDESADAAA